MKVLVLGAKGMLGSEVVNEFSNEEVIAWDVNDLDITNEKQVLKRIQEIEPNIVINCAAYTDFDGCENDVDKAYEVNAHSLPAIATACKRCNATLIHISSYMVFDGKNKEGYLEDDAKIPISVYGKAKAIGEDLVRKHMDDFRIVRTCWLCGKSGICRINEILQKLKTETEVDVAQDLYGRPTYAKDVAIALREIIEKPPGIYHVTNSYNCSRFELAKEMARLLDSECKINPLNQDDYLEDLKIHKPGMKLATRPKYCYLLNDKITPLRGWKEALEDYLKDTSDLKKTN